MASVQYFTHTGSGGYLNQVEINEELDGSVLRHNNFGWAQGLTAAVLISLAGTGGAVPVGNVHAKSATGGRATISVLPHPIREQSKSMYVSPDRQVSVIKQSFGLNITDLADVLNVKRPTVYEWLSGKEPRRSNQERIYQLYELASGWQNSNGYNLSKYVHNPIHDGKSLYDFLSSEIIDSEKIIFVLNKLRDQINVSKMGSINEILRSRGFSDLSVDEQENSISHVSSSVYNNED